jgi:ABC-type glycerol-3-phosphate transport system permease component
MGLHAISRLVFTFLYLLLHIPSHSLQLNLWHSCRQVGDLVKYSNLISKASFTTFNWLFIFNWLLIYVMNGDHGAFLCKLWGYGTILFLFSLRKGARNYMGICDNPFHSFGGIGKENYGDMGQSSCLRQGIWNYFNISFSSQLISYILSTFQSYKLYKQVKVKNIHLHTIIFIRSVQM